jgi:peptide/nickel transport system ATP-binding protein
VEDLGVSYRVRRGFLKAVRDASFELDHGETLGVVGESGCGKTTLGLSILRLLPSNSKIDHGRILFDGVDLLEVPEEELRKIRWKQISMIFQSSMNCLDPVRKVGDSIVDAILANEDISKQEAQDRVYEAMELVDLHASRAESYPHELSGGMKQRVMVAMSLVCNPDLIIADEPTTALDVVLQDFVFENIEEIQKKLGYALIIISHDISIIAENCEKMAVMYAGSLLEYGDIFSIFERPKNPYTAALLQSRIDIKGPLDRLVPLEGAPPDLVNPSFSSCPFEPRCIMSKKICGKKKPPLVQTGDNHFSRCFFPEEVVEAYDF